ncbi:hypothetical protein PsorP6_000633 [Peronosclerospora sorghi]|uniref:Uncharacterized protein n=1 Tax=Peronosclerospora sorghi TaxID=230839 RepID=A0ACC0WSZ6_9STRA|nr:hypothetical protein PsorP6_000633 [Peronosclerospora sorghi]
MFRGEGPGVHRNTVLMPSYFDCICCALRSVNPFSCMATAKIPNAVLFVIRTPPILVLRAQSVIIAKFPGTSNHSTMEV